MNEHIFGYIIIGSTQVVMLLILLKLKTTRSNPSSGDNLHERFAPIKHDHPQYMLGEECGENHKRDEAHDNAQVADIKASIRGMELKLEKHNEQAETRASLLHTRINTLIGPIHELTGRFNDHVSDKDKHHKGAS